MNFTIDSVVPVILRFAVSLRNLPPDFQDNVQQYAGARSVRMARRDVRSADAAKIHAVAEVKAREQQFNSIVNRIPGRDEITRGRGNTCQTFGKQPYTHRKIHTTFE